jgi:hypothetical protein
MITQKQLEANRRNAQKSTGPRSDTGKAASSMNALKTGIHAESMLIPGEDPAELETLTAEYYSAHPPRSPEHRAIIDIIIRDEWQLRRLANIEAQLFAFEMDAQETVANRPLTYPLAGAFYAESQQFARLQRRIDSTRRSIERAIKQLEHLEAVTPVPDLPTDELRNEPANAEPEPIQQHSSPASPTPAVPDVPITPEEPPIAA